MCKYRILQFGCPCYDPSHAQPSVEIWLSGCDRPQLLPSTPGWPPICLTTHFCFPAQRISYHPCVICFMENNVGSTRWDYLAQIRECLDRLDNHLGGNPWMEITLRPYASVWADFVLHNTSAILPVDMEAIEGGGFVDFTCVEQPDLSGGDAQGGYAGELAMDDIPDSDLEDDLDEWDTEDDEAMDGDDV